MIDYDNDELKNKYMKLLLQKYPKSYSIDTKYKMLMKSVFDFIPTTDDIRFKSSKVKLILKNYKDNIKMFDNLCLFYKLIDNCYVNNTTIKDIYYQTLCCIEASFEKKRRGSDFETSRNNIEESQYGLAINTSERNLDILKDFGPAFNNPHSYYDAPIIINGIKYRINTVCCTNSILIQPFNEYDIENIYEYDYNELYLYLRNKKIKTMEVNWVIKTCTCT
jgi:hypothetical protein